MAIKKVVGLPRDDDTALGAKVQHFIGIAGYRLPLSDLLNKNIAVAVGLAEENWSRSKRRPTVDEARLSRLARHLRFEEWGLTYEALILPTLGDFKNMLKADRVGAYGGGDADFARSALMTARNFKPNGISIERFAGTRAGGMGGDPDAGPTYPMFRPGDAAILRIKHPEGGHLLVLNDCPDGEVICLMPSHLAPGTDVHGEATRLPTDRSARATIPIGAEDNGRFRLFAVWSREPLGVSFLAKIRNGTGAPYVLKPEEFRQVAEAVGRIESRNEKQRTSTEYEVRSADYGVEKT